MTRIAAQTEFDAAFAAGEREFEVSTDCELIISIADALTLKVRDGSQPRVMACGSSQPRVEAYDSSQPRVVAYSSSQLRVMACGSSQPRVEAYDSSQPRVVAYDSSQPRVVACGSSQPRVVACGSSQPCVEACGSSQPCVEAYDSSQPRVVAYGSSQPRVVACGSSQPRVVACGHVQLSTAGNVAVEVEPNSQVAILAEQVRAITGAAAHLIRREAPSSIETWCAEYGLTITDGIVTLFKAVCDDFRSLHGMSYSPSTIPIAADWDGGRQECGGGLHFAPCPVMALGFDRDATKFIACPVRMADMRIPQPTDTFQNKIKARCCAGPVWEVDIDGFAAEGKG